MFERSTSIELQGPAKGGQSGTLVFSGRLVRQRVGKGIQFATKPRLKRPPPEIRPAKIACLLAAAHWIQDLIADGDFRDMADVARYFGVTRARISQIVDLTLLAPDIQQQVLFLQGPDGHCDVSERDLRALVRTMDWGEQRQRWLQSRASESHRIHS